MRRIGLAWSNRRGKKKKKKRSDTFDWYDKVPVIYLVDRVGSERGVGRHQEMTTRRWDERSDDADQVIIHISRVSQCLRACRHNRRDLNKNHIHGVTTQSASPSWGRNAQRQKTAVNTHELISLVKRGCLQMQAVRIDARKCTIVEYNDRVCVVREPLECQ